MKTSKELKKDVFSRIMGCFGELSMMFFLSVGGLSVFVLAYIFAAGLIGISGAADINEESSVLSYGVLFLIFIAGLILLMIAATPLLYGIDWYRIQQIRGNSVHARSVFSCYTSIKKLWQVLRLNSILIIRKLYVIVPVAGISALGFYAAGLVGDNTDSKVLYYAVFLLAVVITAGMICLIAYFNVRYAAVPYLYALEPNRPASELIDESKRLMNGKNHYLAKIMLSVSGWFVPCIIIFPTIFVVPYLQMIYTAAINEIILAGGGGEEQTDGNVNTGTEFPIEKGTG